MDVVPCFVDETGSLHNPTQPLLAVGLLVVQDVGALTDALYTASFNFNARIREKRLALQREIRQHPSEQVRLQDLQFLLAKTRHHEYKFTGINKENLQDYISLLNLFFAAGSSEFHAIVLERTEEALSHFGRDSWPVYVQVTKKLLQHRLRHPSFVCCDWQARPKHQKLSLEDECCTLKHVVGCLRITSETSPFLQIVDLLLGSISFDWRDGRGLVERSGSSALKRELVTFVKDALGMPPSGRFLQGECRFFSRRSPIRFTAWQPEPDRVNMPRARGMQRGQFAPGE